MALRLADLTRTIQGLTDPVPGTGLRYDDPGYDVLARDAERRHRLPQGILDAIRRRGERSNANQVSSAGARGVYQFIPETRRGMMRIHGVDPWANQRSATEAAALHLSDDYRRTGSWDTAIARYHGGPSERNWGPQNRAYRQRVGSFEDRLPLPMSEGLDPSTGEETVQQTPEPPRLAAPTSDAGPSVPIAASKEPAIRRRRGILGTLQDIFMPDPGSLWAGALRGGIWNARESQQAYRQGQDTARTQSEMSEIERQQAHIRLKQLLTQGEYQIAGNNVVHRRPDGTVEMLPAPTTPGETERLIDRWRRTEDPAERELLERAIRGYQYTPEVITRQAEGRERVARARPRAPTAREQSQYDPPSGFVRR